jgi:hypothetical protein
MYPWEASQFSRVSYLIDRLSLRDGAIAKSPGTSDIGGTSDVLYGYIADPG